MSRWLSTDGFDLPTPVHVQVKEFVMHEFSARSVAALDADLRALAAATRHARGQLDEVRCRLRELADLEAELVVAVELHLRRIDDVLDERSGAVQDAGGEPRLCSTAGHTPLPAWDGSDGFSAGVASR